MSTPDIRSRIESLDRAHTWRTRLVASSNLCAVIPALLKILNDFTARSQSESNSDSKSDLELESDSDSDRAPNSYRSLLLNLRRAETTRKAAALLVQLTRARPVPGPDCAAGSVAPATNRHELQAHITVPRIAGMTSGVPAAPPTIVDQGPSRASQAPRFVPTSTDKLTTPVLPARVGGLDWRTTPDPQPATPDRTHSPHPTADPWHASTPRAHSGPNPIPIPISNPVLTPLDLNDLLTNLLPHLQTLAAELNLPTEDLGPQDIGPESLAAAGPREHWP